MSQLRYTEINGELWFHLSDFCKIIKLTNPSEVIWSIECANRKCFENTSSRKSWFVNEEGFYSLVLFCRDSRNPGTPAYKFRKWVTGNLLVTLRKGELKIGVNYKQHFLSLGFVLEECAESKPVLVPHGKRVKPLDNAYCPIPYRS